MMIQLEKFCSYIDTDSQTQHQCWSQTPGRRTLSVASSRGADLRDTIDCDRQLLPDTVCTDQPRGMEPVECAAGPPTVGHGHALQRDYAAKVGATSLSMIEVGNGIELEVAQAGYAVPALFSSCTSG